MKCLFSPVGKAGSGGWGKRRGRRSGNLEKPRDGRKETMEAQWQPERGLQIVTGRRACVSGVLVRLQGLHLCGEKIGVYCTGRRPSFLSNPFWGQSGGAVRASPGQGPSPSPSSDPEALTPYHSTSHLLALHLGEASGS